MDIQQVVARYEQLRREVADQFRLGPKWQGMPALMEEMSVLRRQYQTLTRTAVVPGGVAFASGQGVH